MGTFRVTAAMITSRLATATGADATVRLRAAIGGGVLLASLYTAARGSLRELAVVAAAGALLAFLRWPALGVAAVVPVALTVRFSVGTGTDTTINAPTMLVGFLTVAWLLEMVARRRVALRLTTTTVALLAFMAVSVLAFASGTQPWLAYAETASLPAQAGGLAIYLLSACAFLLVAHQMHDVRWLQFTTWLFLALGALHVLLSIVPGGSGMSRALIGSAGLGSLFWTWFAAHATGQAVFNQKLAAGWRLALAGVLGGNLYVGFVLHQDWTSGWLPALVACLVALLVGAPRLAPLVALVGAATAVVGGSSVAQYVLGGDNEYSLLTRVEAWRVLGTVIGINPILGLGFANYSWYTSLFPILGYYVHFNSHNNYVDLVAQTGVVGLACFLWFAWALIRLGWRLRDRVESGFSVAYVHSAIGGLAGTIVAATLGDWVLPYVYNVGFSGFRASVLGWLFLGGLMVLERTAAHRAAAARQTS
jgi:hypothetical protein